MARVFVIRYAVLLLIAVGVLAAVPVTPAQTPPEKKLEEVQGQLQSLGQAIEDLRRELKRAEQQPPAKEDAAKAAAPKPAEDAVSKQSSKDVIARIREEGLKHSQVMQTLSHLSDVIGPRLTGSRELRRANEWTSDKMASWGLSNAHLEAWGPFGRGWTLKRFSAQVVEPQTIPLIAFPKAWSPGFDEPITAEVVYFDAKTEADLEKYHGKLQGAIVLVGKVPEGTPQFESRARRFSEADLLSMANATEGPRRRRPPEQPAQRGTNEPVQNAAQAGAARDRNGDVGPPLPSQRALSFVAAEGAAVLVTPSFAGDEGTLFVASATVPSPWRPKAKDDRTAAQSGNDEVAIVGGQPLRRLDMANLARSWSKDAPKIPAQIALTGEHYGRLVRMAQQGQKLKMTVDLQVQFYDDDLMAYNTIAEIPGTDLKDEVVMLGGHIDSWHAGTGATDDAAGVAAAMEAARMITALKLQPRRTIRVALWSGEEQGLLGSRAYVKKHFGEFAEEGSTDAKKPGEAESSPQQDSDGKAKAAAGHSRPPRKLVRQPEYEKLAAYFNLDNGGGKIRGIYLQSNEAARPIFRKWLESFRDLGAETISLADTGGTDHLAFDAVGLPGFQFIQDPIDYFGRTHHSNVDVYEHVLAEDLKQAATIMAAFAYNAAMADEKLPRKPAP